jgi:hypothetical protein
MADLSLEDIGALLDEKLQPIATKLDEHAKKLDQHGQRLDAMTAEPRQRSLKPLLVAFSAVAAVVVLALAGRVVLGTFNGGAGQSSAATAPRLLYADDFSSSASGLFLEGQRGIATLPGDRASAAWDYAYQDGALVAHVTAPSLPLQGRVIGGAARAANRLTGDFAFEVKAKAATSAVYALYGLRFFPGSREFGFGIQPGQKSYQVWEIFQPPFLVARSNAVEPGEAENLLRLELRGNAMRLFINGQEIDGRQDEAFGVRPASVGVLFDTRAMPNEALVEIRFRDFKVYSL